MRSWRSLERGARSLVLALSLVSGTASAAEALTPAPGSPLRLVVIDAVRSQLRIHSKFNVAHMKVSGHWAYFEGTEIVPLEAGAWQETAQTVRVLLRHSAGNWRPVLLWSLPRNNEYPLARFERELNRMRQTHAVPAGLFQ